LLEPIVQIRWRNGPSAGDPHSRGENLIGWLNLDMHDFCDFTYDNYRETADPTTPIGFPGVAQVVNLVPRAQTLFYEPPQNGSNITFTVTTLNNNPVDTNAIAMCINGTNVSSQLVITDVSSLLVSAFFVRYTNTLAANTIYQGQIIALDTSGKGTTNNWVFDTFPTNGTVVIEAEDYNYNAGQCQDNPVV